MHYIYPLITFASWCFPNFVTMKTKLLLCCLLFTLGLSAQATLDSIEQPQNIKPMTVDIWSDIACPFCYIGKRKLEQAIANLGIEDSVEIIWHSFQLDPETKPTPGEPYLTTLMAKKGWSRPQVDQIISNVSNMAQEVGLEFDFDKMISANTFDGHRLIHLADSFGLQDSCKEALLRAHFLEGKDIANHQTLLTLGVSIGLPATEVTAMLASDRYNTEVQADIQAARENRINGVPFFIINGKYTISGAQSVSVFERALTEK
jgi:predicted DsbA family dithiol-disulfide isomerase